jgi:DNA adenine methylase
MRHATASLQDASEGPIRAHPFLKWAGGKWSIASQIERLLPHDWCGRVYREPFLGGGAMFFWLQPWLTERIVLSDTLGDLVTSYEVVQKSPEALITHLEHLKAAHSTSHFYEIRTAFNERRDAPRVERAAWLIYLNKTCYNGLYRTNQSGGFNVPVGRFVNPGVVDPPALRLSSAALADAELRRARFDALLDDAQEGDLIYFDPPYVPVSKTASFSSYSDGCFTLADQARLAEVFRALDGRGCLLVLSNSDTPEVRRLYEGYDVSQIFAPRAISSKASTRGEIAELVIRNVGRYPRRGALVH